MTTTSTFSFNLSGPVNISGVPPPPATTTTAPITSDMYVSTLSSASSTRPFTKIQTNGGKVLMFMTRQELGAYNFKVYSNKPYTVDVKMTPTFTGGTPSLKRLDIIWNWEVALNQAVGVKNKADTYLNPLAFIYNYIPLEQALNNDQPLEGNHYQPTDISVTDMADTSKFMPVLLKNKDQQQQRIMLLENSTLDLNTDSFITSDFNVNQDIYSSDLRLNDYRYFLTQVFDCKNNSTTRSINNSKYTYSYDYDGNSLIDNIRKVLNTYRYTVGGIIPASSAAVKNIIDNNIDDNKSVLTDAHDFYPVLFDTLTEPTVDTFLSTSKGIPKMKVMAAPTGNGPSGFPSTVLNINGNVAAQLDSSSVANLNKTMFHSFQAVPMYNLASTARTLVRTIDTCTESQAVCTTADGVKIYTVNRAKQYSVIDDVIKELVPIVIMEVNQTTETQSFTLGLSVSITIKMS